MHQISKALCEIYAELHKRGHVKFPLHEEQKNRIDTIVKNINGKYFGVEKYSTPEDRAVAYLCFIIKDHPVTDGNKRLALLSFQVYCDVFSLQILKNLPYTLDEYAVAIEKSQDLSMDELIKTIKRILFNK